MENIKGDLLLNIKDIENGDNYKLYSLREDLYLNEKVEIYHLSKEEDSYYISINKSLSFKQNVELKEKVDKFLLNQQSLDKYKMMGLSNSETQALMDNSNEAYLIKEGNDIRGVYANGVEFTYPGIIKIEKIEY